MTEPSPPAMPRASTTGPLRLLLASPEKCLALGLTPRARIIGALIHGQKPELFTTAPIQAVTTLLDQVGWSVSDVDLFELNESFAVVALACSKARRAATVEDQHLRRCRTAWPPHWL